MSTNHTPGPWFPYKRPEPVGYAEYEIHYGTSGECVAEVVHGAGNAHLLAAAPDLLSALSNLEVAANSAQFCYDRRPENFAAALEQLKADAEIARLVIAKAAGSAA